MVVQICYKPHAGAVIISFKSRPGMGSERKMAVTAEFLIYVTQYEKKWRMVVSKYSNLIKKKLQIIPWSKIVYD